MVNPLKCSSFIVECRPDFRIFMTLKQRSAEQGVNGNAAAMQNNLITFTKRFGAFANTSCIEGDDVMEM